MTLPPSIRVNARVNFPSRVKGAVFVAVSKLNGVYSITPDYTKLAPAATIKSTQIFALFDTVTKLWSTASATALAASDDELLPITNPNVLPQLQHVYAGGPVKIFVNGQAFFPLGPTPAFSISGQTVIWSAANSGVNIAPGDTVVISYTHA